jgi:hypothetical protein
LLYKITEMRFGTKTSLLKNYNRGKRCKVKG